MFLTSVPSIRSILVKATPARENRSGLRSLHLCCLLLCSLRLFKLDTGQRPLSGFTDEDTGAQMGDTVCPVPRSTLELWGRHPRDRNAWLSPSPMLLNIPRVRPAGLALTVP